MTPYEITGLCLALVVFTIAVRMSLVPPRSSRPASGKLAPSTEPRWDFCKGHDNISFQSLKAEEGYIRPFGKRMRPPFDHYYQGVIMLTPRMLEGVNIQRKMRGKSSLNMAGFKNAVAHAWDRWEIPRYSSTTGWLAYLISYQCLMLDHESSRVSTDGNGLVIEFNKPYYGQGHEYPEAGVAGTSDYKTATDAARIADIYAEIAERIRA